MSVTNHQGGEGNRLAEDGCLVISNVLPLLFSKPQFLNACPNLTLAVSEESLRQRKSLTLGRHATTADGKVVKVITIRITLNECLISSNLIPATLPLPQRKSSAPAAASFHAAFAEAHHYWAKTSSFLRSCMKRGIMCFIHSS